MAKQIDWEAVERDYRAGVMTLRAIGEEYGVSHVAVKKRADKEGWARDLAAKIKAKADALVTKAAVTKEVTSERKLADQEVVEANAQLQADIILAHRSDIQRSRRVAMSLLDELEELTGNRELFAELGELLRSEDDKGQDRLNDLYMKIVAMPGRVDSMKKLADTLKVLVTAEREAFGIDEKKTTGKTLEDFLDAIGD